MTRSPLLLLSAAAVALAAAPRATGGLLEVPQQYPTIQAAVNAAQFGDLIAISKGTYVETVDVVSKAGVVLIGLGKVVWKAPPNPAPGAALLEIDQSNTILVKNLRFQGDVSRGVRISSSSNVLVADCRFDVAGTLSTGVYAEFSSDLRVVDNVFRGVAYGAFTSVDVDDSQVVGNDVRHAQGIVFRVHGDRNSIVDNRIRNAGLGVFVEDPTSEENLVAGNVMKDVYQGVLAETGPSTAVLENVVTKAAQHGIWSRSPGGTVAGNAVRKAGLEGVEPGVLLSSSGQTAAGNVVQKCGADGLLVFGADHEILVNEVKKVAGTGCVLDGTGFLLVGNVFAKSGAYDLDVTAATGVSLVENEYDTVAP